MIKEREDYECSPLYKFIKEDFLKDELYKKLDTSIVLNNNLTHNDLSVYLGILYYSSYKPKYKQIISSSSLFNITGISQTNQTRSILKLEKLDFITVYRRRYESRFQVNSKPKKYLPLRLEQFEGMKLGAKNYVRKLRGLALSNGNNFIPNYKKAKEKFGNKLSREEYSKIKALFDSFEDDSFDDNPDDYLDIKIYLSLSN